MSYMDNTIHKNPENFCKGDKNIVEIVLKRAETPQLT